MIIEYLIDKDKYKKLLKEINFTALNGLEVKSRNSKTQGKDNFILRLYSPDDSKKGKKALSDINKLVKEKLSENNITFRLLFNEVSQDYAKQLFPLLCEFETKLRKFIQSVLFDLNEEAEKRICKKLENNKIINAKIQKLGYNFLEDAELGGLIPFLFANYDLYAEIDDFKKKAENRCASREDIIDFIKNSKKKTIWEEFFAENFSDSILPKKIQEIKSYRNAVMHFHEIDEEYFVKAKIEISEGIKDLDKQIKKGIVVEISDYKIDVLSNNINYVYNLVRHHESYQKNIADILVKLSDKINYSIKSINNFYDYIDPQRKYLFEFMTSPKLETISPKMFSDAWLDVSKMETDIKPDEIERDDADKENSKTKNDENK